MLLLGVKEENHWLMSEWVLRYSVGWMHILKACAFASKDLTELEILSDGKVISYVDREDIMNFKESRMLVFRGVSKILKVAVMISLYNQTNSAQVSVAMVTEEFERADYENFNKSMSQYLNSIELSMYL